MFGCRLGRRQREVSIRVLIETCTILMSVPRLACFVLDPYVHSIFPLIVAQHFGAFAESYPSYFTSHRLKLHRIFNLHLPCHSFTDPSTFFHASRCVIFVNIRVLIPSCKTAASSNSAHQTTLTHALSSPLLPLNVSWSPHPTASTSLASSPLPPSHHSPPTPPIVVSGTNASPSNGPTRISATSTATPLRSPSAATAPVVTLYSTNYDTS